MTVAVDEPTARRMILRAVRAVGEVELDIDVNFFDAGLTSLMLVRIQDYINRSLGIELPAWVPFKYPTGRALARYISTTADDENRSSPPAPADVSRTPSGSIARRRRELRSRLRNR